VFSGQTELQVAWRLRHTSPSCGSHLQSHSHINTAVCSSKKSTLEEAVLRSQKSRAIVFVGCVSNYASHPAKVVHVVSRPHTSQMPRRFAVDNSSDGEELRGERNYVDTSGVDH
jgi:hypothetical protein